MTNRYPYNANDPNGLLVEQNNSSLVVGGVRTSPAVRLPQASDPCRASTINAPAKELCDRLAVLEAKTPYMDEDAAVNAGPLRVAGVVNASSFSVGSDINKTVIIAAPDAGVAAVAATGAGSNVSANGSGAYLSGPTVKTDELVAKTAEGYITVSSNLDASGQHISVGEIETNNIFANTISADGAISAGGNVTAGGFRGQGALACVVRSASMGFSAKGNEYCLAATNITGFGATRDDNNFIVIDESSRQGVPVLVSSLDNITNSTCYINNDGYVCSGREPNGVSLAGTLLVISI